MPTCWYPFPEDHEHAGKFYEGYMPSGNEQNLCQISGAVLKPPAGGKIVSALDVLDAEVKTAKNLWGAVRKDVEAVGKASFLAAPKRQIDVALKNALEQGEAGDIATARVNLERAEQEIAKLQVALAGVVPLPAVPVAAVVPASGG